MGEYNKAGGGGLIIVGKEDTAMGILTSVHGLRWWLQWLEKQEITVAIGGGDIR